MFLPLEITKKVVFLELALRKQWRRGLINRNGKSHTCDVFVEGNGVIAEGSATHPEEAIATPPVAETKAASDEDDGSDVDLFGEETEEEKKVVEECVAAVKASGKKKE